MWSSTPPLPLDGYDPQTRTFASLNVCVLYNGRTGLSLLGLALFHSQYSMPKSAEPINEIID